MSKKINRAVELLAEDQPIYYTGAHAGHVLTYEQGKEDAATWADYINVGMEHGSFDMAGLDEYLRGLIAGGPTRSGHRTPAIIVEAPVEGRSEEIVRYNAWQFRQILGRGAHGILLCQAESAGAVRAFVESCRYPVNTIGVGDDLGRRYARRWLRGRVCRRVGRESRRVSSQGRSLAAQSGRRVAVRAENRVGGRPAPHRGNPVRTGDRLCRNGPGRLEPFAGVSDDAAAVARRDAGDARAGQGGVSAKRRGLLGRIHTRNGCGEN